jgi:asparagine synthase (glutamine-hydrolysing)
MCGIAGVLRQGGVADDRSVVADMLAALARRGPDGDGLEQHGPLTLGHRRLAILDLSEAGHQPMHSASGRYVVSYNGEIYNFRELQRELGLSDGELRSSSDTEILLCAWERWGSDALARMVGQWAFALYDRVEQRLWLVRDRFGEKPLFYHHGDRVLSFASSIPALLRLPWVGRSLDRRALVEYLTLRYVIAPRTVVDGVKKLPGGHLLAVDANGAELRRWYRPQYRAPSHAGEDALVEEFGALLVQACRRCTVSDQPVGVLLSDGIDSNSVRAALGAAGSTPPSFTYTMTDEGAGLVRTSPDGDRPETWEVQVSVRKRLETLVPAFSSFTEPLGDGAALATWLLIRAARAHATVFLCGHGADEVIGGYRLSQDRFRLAGIHRLAWLPAWSLRALIDSKVFGAEPAALRQRAVRRTSARRVPEAARYLIHRPLAPADVAAMLGTGELPEPYLSSVDALYDDCADDASDLDRIQEVMIHTFLAEDILPFADSVAMDSSAELRMPFLDRDLVDFVLHLPPALRVSRWPGRANTKQVLRRWARRHLPRDIAARPKQGFNFGAARDLLAADRSAVLDLILGAPAVRAALPGLSAWLARPDADFRGNLLWALITLGVWSESAGVR